jgi:hypothetical protein
MRPCHRLEAWFYGELSPAAARKMSSHVAECSACAREREWLQLEQRLLRQRTSPPVPELSSISRGRNVQLTHHVATVSLLLAAASVAFVIGRPQSIPLEREEAISMAAPYCTDPAQAMCFDEPRMSLADRPRSEPVLWSKMVDGPSACSVADSVCEARP